MDNPHKPSPEAARLYRLANLMLIGTVAILMFTGVACVGRDAKRAFTKAVRTTCMRVENHTVETTPGRACAVCYAEGKAVAACVTEEVEL